MRRLATALACLAPVGVLALPAAAGADVFGSVSLASEGALPGSTHAQEAEYAHHSVISADGRYVAFEGSFAGHKGIFRRDLQSGEIATVVQGDAINPSISEEGRYISFTTNVRLDEENDANSAADVYVRDMDKASSQPCPKGWEQSQQAREECAFTLVSAVNGSSKGLSYEKPEERSLGALAAGRTAMSANGEYVAFITDTVSNLANPGRPATPTGSEPPETPALQVAVRDLWHMKTELVSVRLDPSTDLPQLDASGQPEPVPSTSEGTGGVVGAAFGGGANIHATFPSEWAGASISADGSTVAWLGQQIAEQAPTLRSPLEPAATPGYTEPLWRRIHEGPMVPTRRVTGGSDPLSPACVASGQTELASPPTLSDPCQGPFATDSGKESTAPVTWASGTASTALPEGADYEPQLSENGTTVAFLATAREVVSGEELNSAQASDDLYVANMQDGFTRAQALKRLTEIASGESDNPARSAPIVDLAISPDGTQVAFASQRTVFPLATLALVSSPSAADTTVELYDADVADETLTRVTGGYEGQPSEAPASTASITDSPSFSADGNMLAFSSDTTNLVYGEGNLSGRSPSEVGNAFAVGRLQFAAVPTPEYFSPAPANPPLAPAWALGATALSRRDGSVLLDVEVPGAGALRASAQSSVLVRSAVRVGRAKRRTRVTVQTRTVADKAADALAQELIPVDLRLAKSYSPLADTRRGLSATIDLTFSAPGRPALHESVPVIFLRAQRPYRFKGRTRAAARRTRRRGGR